MFAVQANGSNIMTVEALAQDGKLHPLQAAFQDHHALQCGFCTPGFLLAGVHLLETDSDIEDEAEIREAVSGHICRCTGYQNIVDAIADVASQRRENKA
jgi:aerobic-type carbon monoxide dehydrogenase small subunit (CoxS/CutS family)